MPNNFAFKNYKSVVFDCDGVILDSNRIKTQGFCECSKQFGEEVASALVKYHLKNTGISRYEKFKYLICDLMSKTQRDIFKPDIKQLTSLYSKYTKQKLRNSAVTPMLGEIRKANPSQGWLVCSGSDQKDLHEILSYKHIRAYVHTYASVKMPRSGNIHWRW